MFPSMTVLEQIKGPVPACVSFSVTSFLQQEATRVIENVVFILMMLAQTPYDD